MPDGAIYDFDLVRFQGPTVPQEFSVNIAATATRAVKYDPDRIAVTITNTGGFEMRWSTLSGVSLAASQILGVGQTVVLQVQNDGAICGSELWFMSPGGAGTINVLALRRQRKG